MFDINQDGKISKEEIKQILAGPRAGSVGED